MSRLHRCIVSTVALLAAALPARAADTLVRLGTVFRNEMTPQKIVVTAPADRDIEVASAKVTCDCLQPLFAPVTLHRGESHAFPFNYLSHGAGRVDVGVEFVSSTGAVVARATVVGFVTERASWLSVGDAAAEAKQGRAKILDLRRAERFAAGHIAHAENVQPFALKARTDLRGARIILVDDGFAPDAIADRILTLRQLGFKDVVALQGGMAAWVRAGQSVEGVGGSHWRAATISAAEFASANAASEWRIVEADAAVRPYADATKVADWNAAVREVGKLAPSPADRMPLNTLVVASSEADYERIERAVGATAPGPLFYVAGGRNALEQLGYTQTAVAAATHQMINVRSDAHAHGVVSGPCSSCGK